MRIARIIWRHTQFQSTPLTRGETVVHAETVIQIDFNPLPSHEGRPDFFLHLANSFIFQSTPLTRGETISHFVIFADIEISIHSPHTRGDPSL